MLVYSIQVVIRVNVYANYQEKNSFFLQRLDMGQSTTNRLSICLQSWMKLTVPVTIF